MINLSNIRSDRYTVNWHESDFKGFASPDVICNYLGESAWRQAGEQGFGFEDAEKLGQFWVVLRWYIKLQNYPRWRDEIVVETWPRKPEHLFAFRDYRITDVGGKMLGAATSTWMVLDGVSRRPQRLDLVENKMGLTPEDKILGTDASKITLPLSMPVINEIAVKYNDVDFNGHVTNTRYVEWCLDLFGHDFHQRHYLAELQINFLHECSFDDTVELKMTSTGNTEFIVLASNKQTGENIFAAKLTWLSY